MALGELANELNTEDGYDRTGALIKAWVAEFAAFVKSIDPRHMVPPLSFHIVMLLPGLAV